MCHAHSGAKQDLGGAWLNRNNRRDGQSIAEFALVLPFLMLLLLVVIDFGRAYLGWVELSNAARVAANYAGQNPTASFGTGSTYATLTTNDAAGSNCPLVSVPAPTFVSPSGTVPGAQAQLGDQAQVTLTCQFQMMLSAFPVFGQLLPNPATLSATAYFPVRTGTIDVATSMCTSVPTATLAASPTSGALTSTGFPVTFTPTVTGSPTKWMLDFGDGTVASGSGTPPASVAHTYAAADQPTFDSTGTLQGFTPYVATLTVWNSCGYSAPATSTITVSGLSTWFTYTWPGSTSSAPCSSSTCTLTAGTSLDFQGFAYQTTDGTSGSAASSCTWSWNFGDNNATGSNKNTSSAQDPSHTYSTSGTYFATLAVSCGGSTASSSQAITVAGCVVPPLVGMPLTQANSVWTTAGFSTTPQVVGNTGQGTYTWVTSQNVGSGTVDPTCSTSIHLTVGPTPTPTP